MRNGRYSYLPSTVLGTFWPYSAKTDVKLAGVVAGQRRVLVERTALSLAELLDGNAGADAIVGIEMGKSADLEDTWHYFWR